MEAITLLKNYKKRLEPIMEEYFKVKIEKARKIDPLSEEAVKIIRDFILAGGKRIRPALAYYAFLATGGEETEEVVQVSMSIEFIHAFLLIHDDIIDKDEKRHNVPTVHERYKSIAKKITAKNDHDHFGNSMAIVAGDMAGSMAYEVIFNSSFPDRTILEGMNKIQEIVYKTLPGEMLDVVMEAKGEGTEEEVMRMHEGKTARYTFEGPIHLGCVLAGEKDGKVFENFSDYALPLGKAFQIRDDVLGVFGDEKKLGKPVGSDIIEGKQTLLLVKAHEKCNRKQRKIIENCLRNKNLTDSNINEFRKVIVDTGSLDYSHKLSEQLVKESTQSLEKINFKNQEAKDFFSGIANYIIERQI
jgi:geranylgeranyl diphosphate synthase, type I